jgi:hypothetical protein
MTVSAILESYIGYHEISIHHRKTNLEKLQGFLFLMIESAHQNVLKEKVLL